MPLKLENHLNGAFFPVQQTKILSHWTLDWLSRANRPPLKLVDGIRVSGAGGDASLSLIPLCLFDSTFSSGWHHTDNYNNYVWIQWQHCGIVSVCLFLHNCWDVRRANCSYSETSWAIIRHPPCFFSFPLAGQQCRTSLWESFDSSGWWWEEETQNKFTICHSIVG